MKFMKLGSKSDTFYTAAAVRSVTSDITSDLVVQVKNYRYLLHKFPLLAKSARLQKLCYKFTEHSRHPQELNLSDFPGGPEAFELCVKFCYGIEMTVSASNIVAARCAAEYLQMTEEVESGNLIFKLGVFFNSCVLNCWKDTIVALQSTRNFAALSEKLEITSRCCAAISAKILAHPLKLDSPRNCSGRSKSNEGNTESRTNEGNTESATNRKMHKTDKIKTWWCQDLSDLSINLYWRVMIAIKSSREIPVSLIGEALRVYASKWLRNVSKVGSCQEKNSKQMLILESVTSLLPFERGSASCRFLCKLLKAANMLNALSSTKMELAQRIALQLEEASVGDLLIPSPPELDHVLYDVEIVITILEQFTLREQSPPSSPRGMNGGFKKRRSRSSDENNKFLEIRRLSSASHSTKFKVSKLVDDYLRTIAKDVNLPLSEFLAVTESVPDFARLDHDGLYKAIDTYLEMHPALGKSERKRICKALNCKKLTTDVSLHAASNEKLPLRVLVQVLLLQHIRSPMSDQPAHHDTSKPQAPSTRSHSAEDQWSRTGPKSMKPSVEEKSIEANTFDGDAYAISKSCMPKNLCAIPAKPMKMFSKCTNVYSKKSD